MLPLLLLNSCCCYRDYDNDVESRTLSELIRIVLRLTIMTSMMIIVLRIIDDHDGENDALNKHIIY